MGALAEKLVHPAFLGLSCGLGVWQIAGLWTLLLLIVTGLMHTFEVRMGIAADKKADEAMRHGFSKVRVEHRGCSQTGSAPT